MAVEPGKYRHRVAIERRVEVQDATTGELTHTWAPIALSSSVDTSAIAAECLTGPGREVMLGNAPRAAVALRVSLRWFPGLQATDRVVWDGQNYDIVSIETDRTARLEYRLACSAGLNDGSR